MEPGSEMAGYELVMPFVVCASAGGPYDDAAFVAGWRLGCLDRDLAAAAAAHLPAAATARPADMPQVDLIAMAHGYRTVATPWAEAPDEWVCVDFEPAAEG